MHYSIYKASGEIVRMLQNFSLEEVTNSLQPGEFIYEGFSDAGVQYIENNTLIPRPKVEDTAVWSAKNIDPEIGGAITLSPLPVNTKVSVSVPPGAIPPEPEIINTTSFVFESVIPGTYFVTCNPPFPYQASYIETIHVSKLVGEAVMSDTAAAELLGPDQLVGDALVSVTTSAGLTTSIPLAGAANELSMTQAELLTRLESKSLVVDNATGALSFTERGFATETDRAGADMTTAIDLGGNAEETDIADGSMGGAGPIP